MRKMDSDLTYTVDFSQVIGVESWELEQAHRKLKRKERIKRNPNWGYHVVYSKKRGYHSLGSAIEYLKFKGEKKND